MHSLKALNIALVICFLFCGCGQVPVDPGDGGFKTRLSVQEGEHRFIGIPLKFWATFTDPVQDKSEISWIKGAGTLVKRVDVTTSNPALSDTVWITWDHLPKSSVGTDGRTMQYIDTVTVAVNGVHSNSGKILINIENIAPSVDYIIINNIKYPSYGDSIFFPVHAGAQVDMRVSLYDPLKITPVQITWPTNLGVSRINDTLYSFQASESIIDLTDSVFLQDGDGAGRSGILRWQTFNETGAIWVASTKEVVKISSRGQIILRDNQTFNSIADIGINSSASELYILDKAQNAERVRKFDTYTFSEYTGFLLSAQFYIGLQIMAVDERFIWVSQGEYKAVDSSRIDKYSRHDGSMAGVSIYGISGQISAMVMNKARRDELWYLNSRDNKIYMALNGVAQHALDSLIQNPKHITYDPEENICWVANFEEVIAIDRNGILLGRVKGFSHITSISSRLGFCWVADQSNNRVVKLDWQELGERTVGPRDLVINFEDPLKLEAIVHPDTGCWVINQSSGSIVRLDKLGKEKARATGITAPIFLSTHQGF